MRILNARGGRFVLEEAPSPVPGEGEVLVETRAIGINRADVMQKEGNYPPPPGWPQWPGLECSGVVLSAPGQSRFKPGDRVVALLGGGGYAERVCVPCGMVLPLPGALGFEEGASLPEAFATSYLNLVVEGAMKPGDRVFVQAGASGLGISAIQLAKAFGASVLTSVGRRDKAEFVKRLGADEVVVRGEKPLPDAIAAFKPDIAIDCVAGSGMGASIEGMARGGRWIVIATLGGEAATLDMGKFFRLGVRLIGSTLRSRTMEEKSRVMASLEREIWPMLNDGRIKPVVHSVFPLEKGNEAQAVLERNENIGKVVLVP